MNGYITITVEGSLTGLKFAYPAIRLFLEAMADKGQFYYTENDNGEVSSMTLEGLAKLIQCGYINNCMIKEVEPDLKYEHFYNWVEKSETDESVKQAIQDVLTCYAETQYAKRIEKAAAELEKKNLTAA